MPDELSRARRDRRVALGQGLAVVALFAALGVAAGWVWHELWAPPLGVVSDHTWYPQPYMPGRQAEFDAIALYVLVALAAGVIGGLVCALVLDRTELVTVAALAVGSCLAAWVMARVGMSLGPPDPDVLAKTVPDGERLPGDLTLTGLSPYVALPVGALSATLVVFLATINRRPQ